MLINIHLLIYIHLFIIFIYKPMLTYIHMLKRLKKSQFSDVPRGTIHMYITIHLLTYIHMFIDEKKFGY